MTNMADPKREDLLGTFQSHKVVKAGKIIALGLDHAQPWVHVEGGSGGIVHFPVMPLMIERFTPVIGDYYVVYDDGYASFSPKKAFEEGYRRV